MRLYWAGTPVRFLPTRVSYPENGISHFRALRDNAQISLMHTQLVCGMLWRLFGSLSNRLLKNNTNHHAHWSQQRERGSAWGMRFCLGCYRLLGKRALNVLLYPIIGWFFLFATSARRESQRYLQRVLDHPPTQLDSFRHFLAFGRAIVDKLAAWNGDIQRDDVLFPNRELLVQQAASGKGAVIITSHLGNVDMCRALIHCVPGIQMNVLLFTQHAEGINRLLQTVNASAGMKMLQINEIGPDTAMLLHEKVQQGEFIVIAADRTSPTSLHRVSQALFFGQQASFPQGPFILAALLECPVFLLFALNNGKQYEISLEHFADALHFPRSQREALLSDVIQGYASRLEHYCRLAPLQWFNFFNFWPDNDSK